MYNRIEMKQNKWSNKLIWNFSKFFKYFSYESMIYTKLAIYKRNLQWTIHCEYAWSWGVTQLGQYETAG